MWIPVFQGHKEMENLFQQERGFGEVLGESQNPQSDSKMFLISLESLRNVVRNGYSHCRQSGLGELRTLGRLWVVIPTGSPGLEQPQAQLWHYPCPPTASPGIPGHGHSCGEPQTPVREGCGCSRISSLCHNGISSGEGQAGKSRQVQEALSLWSVVQTLVWRGKHSQCANPEQTLLSCQESREEVRTSQRGWTQEQLELGWG